MIQSSKINSKFGQIIIHTNHKGIFKLDLPNKSQNIKNQTLLKDFTEIHKKTVKELYEYFFNNRKIFSIPIDLNIPPFYELVLNEVITIPYGTTRSYKEIALKINHEKAYRAVGLANSKNPIPIIIPCHRVINSNGIIGGYGGGSNLKEKLLKFENYK